MSHEGIINEANHIERFAEITDAELTTIKNEIQLALMKHFDIVDDAGALSWITKYAKDFSEYIQEHPEVAGLWRNGDKDTALEILIQAELNGFPHREAA
jgi:hypothetical protein